MEVPSSVQKIGLYGFVGCKSLRVVIIRSVCRMKENHVATSFIWVLEEDELGSDDFQDCFEWDSFGYK
jgi:hypothetical protein